MFLTKIEIDPSRRQARKYLGSPQVMHAVVRRAAGDIATDGPGRILWRTDENYGTTALYLLTPTQPDCSQILSEAAYAGTQARTLDYEPFLQRLAADQLWGFRLTANPTRSIPQGQGMRGKRQGHVTAEQQKSWLLSQADSHGFQVLPLSNSSDSAESFLRVMRRTRPVFGRSNPARGERDRVTINRTVFEGVIRVTDVQALRHALVSGIGRSKAYGCGLMTLARVRS